MNKKQLIRMGVPEGEPARLAARAVAEARKTGMDKDSALDALIALLGDPERYVEDEIFGKLAAAVLETRHPAALREPGAARKPREGTAPWKQWGTDVDIESVEQMRNACRLPVSVAGALMPDAHVGYGLPIGGVLATENAAIPYAVGVDIACRMKMTVLEAPVTALVEKEDWLRNALEKETRFGIGASFHGEKRRDHPVMDEDWSFSKIAASMKNRAWDQLGTSGSGNHFVEYGLLTFYHDDLGLKEGTYLALLSHSGSRGPGNAIATHYSKLAASLRPELPPELRKLAWLDLDTEAGQEYWRAMELMGRYASANHELIHRSIVSRLGVGVLLDVENHHNFAWKERHRGRDVIVHRKGATPAGAGVVGIIPGSMATPGYLVRGKGEPESLNSAAHGAGRRMSRKKAKQSFHWGEVKNYLKERGVKLLAAGLDEVPMAYKDIEAVMAAQRDLVVPVARFDPKLVKMAPAGERAED